MSINRREFMQSTALSLGAGVGGSLGSPAGKLGGPIHEASLRQPSFAVIPVVGDGKWIWIEPPADGQTGYLEPREFEVTVGIELLGRGPAHTIQASTVAPLSFPEQEITDLRIEVEGCVAKVTPVSDCAAQLVISAPRIVRGQRVSAVARYRMQLKKDYRGFSRESFPAAVIPFAIRFHSRPGFRSALRAAR